MFEFIPRRAEVAHIPGESRQPRAAATELANAKGPTGRVVLALALAAVAIGVCVRPAVAAKRARRPQQRGTSDARTRAAAIREIPVERLSAEQRQKVAAVLDRLTIYRRLPVQSFRCDPKLYMHVVNHPEILANIWELMRVDDIVLQPTGPETYRAFDNGQSEGTVEFLFRNHDTHVILASGRYDGPLFAKPVRGTCLLVLKTAFQREPDGAYYVTSRLDAFLSLDHSGAEFLAKTFHPFVVKVADDNFLATGAFMASLSDAAETHPEAVLRVIGRLAHVDPEVRRTFAGITSEVSRRAQHRSIMQAGGFSTPLGTPLRRR